MAFRTIVINTHSKIEYSLNYLVFRTVNETKRILLDEVHTVIFESTYISVTTSLLTELIKRKIKVIFCDEKHNPVSELLPYNVSYNSSRKIANQVKWSKKNKDVVWKSIIQQKIKNQSASLNKRNKSDKANQLMEYCNNVLDGDVTNREGHAAKVYFNNIFYEGFTRNDVHLINDCLDYGYTILLSQFNRVIVSNGYLTQIGIHHIGEFNPFNFSCDLIEPFRFLIDERATKIDKEQNFKEEIIKVLDCNVIIDGKQQSIVNAINIYFLSVVCALETGEINKIKFLEGYAD